MKVNSDDKKPGKVRYLPHHAVYREDKASTKTRIVFDGSRHDGNEVSLNDCVLPGPGSSAKSCLSTSSFPEPFNCNYGRCSKDVFAD